MQGNQNRVGSRRPLVTSSAGDGSSGTDTGAGVLSNPAVYPLISDSNVQSPNLCHLLQNQSQIHFSNPCSSNSSIETSNFPMHQQNLQFPPHQTPNLSAQNPSSQVNAKSFSKAKQRVVPNKRFGKREQEESLERTRGGVSETVKEKTAAGESVTSKKPDGDEEDWKTVNRQNLQQSVDFVNKINERDSSKSKKGMYMPYMNLMMKYKNGSLSIGELKRKVEVVLEEHDDLKRAFMSSIESSPTESRLLMKETYQSDRNMENPTPSYYKLPGVKLGKQNHDQVLNDESISIIIDSERFAEKKLTREEIKKSKEDDDLLKRDLHLESLKSAISYSEDVLNGKIEPEKGKIPLKHCQLIKKVYKRRGPAIVQSLKDDPVKALGVILPTLNLKQQEEEKQRQERIKFLLQIQKIPTKF